jgi:hypothetical protein
LFVDEQRAMAAFTPTGLDILTRELNKESKVDQLVKQQRMLAKHVGRCFTFFRFLDLLVECSIIAFSDPYFSQNRGGTPLVMAEMTCLFLERMELSAGFANIEKKMHRTHTSRMTLLPSRAVIRHIAAAKEALF